MHNARAGVAADDEATPPAQSTVCVGVFRVVDVKPQMRSQLPIPAKADMYCTYMVTCLCVRVFVCVCVCVCVCACVRVVCVEK